MNKYEAIIPLIESAMQTRAQNNNAMTPVQWDAVMQFVVDNWTDTTDLDDPRFGAYMSQNEQLWHTKPAELYKMVTKMPPEFVEALFPVAVARTLLLGGSGNVWEWCQHSQVFMQFATRWKKQVLGTSNIEWWKRRAKMSELATA